MRFIFVILLSFFISRLGSAQATHSFNVAIGVANSWYLHTLSGGKSYPSLFLVSSGGDYIRHGSGEFWVGCGLGFTVRQIPFFRECLGFKTGIQLAEHWFRLRAGLQLKGEKIAHQPFVSLGIARYSHAELFEKQAGHTLTYLSSQTGWYKKWQPLPPFLEFGNRLIRSDFKEHKRNLFLSMALRYYPLPIFNDQISFEYDLNRFTIVQYHLVEFILKAGIQINGHRAK